MLAASTQSNANSQSLDSASWVAKSGAEYNRHLHDDEDKWIRANAKQFAEQNGVTEQVARERLSQQSLKNVDYIWRALLSDGVDSAAKQFLSASGQTFINDLGEQQKLFTAEGNQLSPMEMYGDTANPQFYKDYVQSGISRQLSTGLATEFKYSGVGLAQGASKLYDAIKNDPEAALQGIWAGIKATPDAIKNSTLNTGTALGEGTAVAFNDEITAKLNDIYGMDIGAEQKTLLLLRTVSAAAGANGVAKGAGKLAEVTAKHIDDAVAKAAAKREAQGQAPDATAPDLVPGDTRIVGTDRPAANDHGTPGPCCFAPGTLVATPAGPRAIEQLQVGDLVWSKPEHGGEPFAAAILATHTRTDRPIYQLKLEGIGQSHGTDETLLVTPSHPFYVPAKSDFIPLSDLKQGDLLQSLADGATGGVLSRVTSVELFQPRGKTYNLTVDVGHTFYVGELKTWVHNTGPCGDDARLASAGGAAQGTGQTLREVEVSSVGKGAWSKDLNKPEPNTIYKVDGNKTYQTDSLGRVEKVESNLSLIKNDRNRYRQCVAGKCGVGGDEGGHLIASIFNGPGEILNLLPMNGNLNKGTWKSMENIWASALKEGKQVSVKIKPVYSGKKVRPDSFNVEYSIGSARPKEIVFKNSPGGS